MPVGWAISGANRNDVRLLEPTFGAVAAVGLLEDIGTLHLDRGYDYQRGSLSQTNPGAGLIWGVCGGGGGRSSGWRRWCGWWCRRVAIR